MLQDKGIAHRDISIGNVMIGHNSSDTDKQNIPDITQTIGRLIDLDHAKVDPGYTPVKLFEQLNVTDDQLSIFEAFLVQAKYQVPDKCLSRLLLHDAQGSTLDAFAHWYRLKENMSPKLDKVSIDSTKKQFMLRDCGIFVDETVRPLSVLLAKSTNRFCCCCRPLLPQRSLRGLLRSNSVL